MFKENYYRNMELWLGLRNQLEVDKDPFDSVFKFWNNVPTSKISIDPYDKERWPDPWEMIYENDYCEFKKILAICYTLQLTDRFSRSDFGIHITLDRDKSRYVYLLEVDNKTISIYNNIVGFMNASTVTPVQYSELPQYS
tara:strand:+ start:1931 stop:2350 length:420 start_codon:yes stop_codon:yes gene_type:complete